MEDNKTERAMGSLIAELQERAKELGCLYQIEELLNDPNRPLEEVFKGVIEAIPPGWQYPEICQAEIRYKNKIYTSENFTETPWIQDADITVRDAVEGKICVYYTEPMPALDDGPFLKEETKLIQTIAGRISHFILHQNLKQMFEGQEEKDLAISQLREWRVALDLLRKTDNDLLGRISRKMMNYLCWRGIAEAKSLLQRYGEDLRSANLMGESNQPRQQSSSTNFQLLSDETFRIAAKHLDDDDILTHIQDWIHEDKSNFLVKTLMNTNASIGDTCDAIRRYQHMKPHGVELSRSALSGALVALVRRFFTDQLGYLNVAKKHIEIDDFFSLLENVIAPTGSQGKLGGKSAGLFLAAKILKKARLRNKAIGDIKTPKTWYITSDGLLSFLDYNNLEDLNDQKYKDIEEIRREYPHIVHLLKNSQFPQDLEKGLSMALDDFDDTPLIVRSSSLLEDRLGAVFSGKYKSLFLANQGSKKERLDALKDAVVEVYASVFSPDPLEYRTERGLLDYNEEMGILIQKVVGQKVGKYFLPAYAGIAFNHNEFRWSPRIKREDGLLRVVPGLGTRAVDRLTEDYPVLIAPGRPTLKVNISDDEQIRYAPKKVDLINLEKNCFETKHFTELMHECGDEYPNIDQVVSIYKDGLFHKPMVLTTDFKKDDAVVTFNGLVSDTPFLKQLNAILNSLKNTLGHPVDIEFASDGTDFYLLQCRPQSHAKGDVAVPIPDNLPPGDILFKANRYVSNGLVPEITHIVYVDPEKYAALPKKSLLIEVGRAVGKLNKLLPKRQFVLMGPGRWGSRGDIKLGVRITYSDINNTAMLIEMAKKKGNYLPDLSFGTHFFQDLVESSIRYLPLYPDDESTLFNERFFLDAPNILENLLPEHEGIADVLRVIDVTEYTEGKILRVLMNAETEEAVGVLVNRGSSIKTETGSIPPYPVRTDDHWTWRLRMAEIIAAKMNPTLFGVKAFYVFGSTKNATAGPGSDIDLLIHVQGTAEQQKKLDLWLEGWSLSLAETNYLRTGYRSDGLLDVHLVTDKDIVNKSSFAVKIGAITDPARKLPLGSLT
jgi:predicted nucleotidyltransferase